MGAGFLEVKAAGRVVILVERALEPDEIDKGEAKSRLEEVRRELAKFSGPLTDPDHQTLRTEALWLDAQVRAAS